jgi:hypothetical protein
MEELRELIRQCRSTEVCLHTPSDFPLARLDQATVDHLCAVDPKVKDIYPLSALQHGLLFHTLQDIQAQLPDVGFLYMSCTLRGALDVVAFKRAWEEVFRRHDILRTSFVWDRVDEPLQVVRDMVEPPFEEGDWRRLSVRERRERTEAYLQSNRQRGFDLSKAPLARLALFRVDDDAYQFIWSYHHIIVDGWSVTVLIKEALAFYESLAGGRSLRPEPSRPYGDYISWLRRQDLDAAETYWRAALNGAPAPTSLDNIRPPTHTHNYAEHYGEHSVRLTPEEQARLQSFARGHQLTLNTLILGAWALLLSHYSGNDDVIFGVVVSGRPADLAGVEAMVGLMINTLAFRAQAPAEEELRLWLRKLQERQAELRQYEYSPLPRVQRWSEVRGGKPLFESLLNFMNYPVDEAVREWKGSVEIENLCYEEKVSYPLNLVISVRKGVELKFKYDRRRFGATAIARALALLRATLNEFAARPEARLGAFKRFINEAVREQESERRKGFSEARRKALQNAKLKRPRAD